MIRPTLSAMRAMGASEPNSMRRGWWEAEARSEALHNDRGREEGGERTSVRGGASTSSIAEGGRLKGL